MDYLLTKEIFGPVLTIIIAILIYSLMKKIITKAIKKITNERKKQKTILNLIKNVLKYILIVVVILIILDIYGINTSKIAAGLGIVGVVVGFALQDILKDFFAGISIIIDNQYAIGDNVEINGFRGDVISLGLRSTKIKNAYGEVKIISNRSILEVTNYSLGKSVLLLDLNVSLDANIEKVEEVLEKCLLEIKSLEDVTGDPKLLGIDNLGNSAITYKIMIECKTMQHFDVKRQAYKIIKTSFDKNKITIPYNQIEVHYGK